MLGTIGGTTPQGDVAVLKNLGVAEGFTPGSATDSIVAFMHDAMHRAPGGSQLTSSVSR